MLVWGIGLLGLPYMMRRCLRRNHRHCRSHRRHRHRHGRHRYRQHRDLRSHYLDRSNFSNSGSQNKNHSKNNSRSLLLCSSSSSPSSTSAAHHTIAVVMVIIVLVTFVLLLPRFTWFTQLQTSHLATAAEWTQQKCATLSIRRWRAARLPHEPPLHHEAALQG